VSDSANLLRYTPIEWAFFSRSASLPAVAKPGQAGGRRRGRVIFWVLFGLAALVLAGGAATAFTTGRSFTAPTTSMENTIRPGDRVVADRTAQVRRGDVIVEQQPSVGPGYFVRRVIGLPADHVACCDARGQITVNGKALDETYLYPGDAPSEIRFDATVPKGKLWLLGDHRRISYDSRKTGPLAVRVAGRVFLILRSGHAIFLRTPQTFVADGLAPAGTRTPPAIIGADVSSLAALALLALTIVGVIRHVLRVRRRSRARVPRLPLLDFRDQRLPTIASRHSGSLSSTKNDLVDAHPSLVHLSDPLSTLSA
jgi:signal peptidase I